jgi:hypothetical protein
MDVSYSDPWAVIVGAFLGIFLVLVAVETLIGWGSRAAQMGADDE